MKKNKFIFLALSIILLTGCSTTKIESGSKVDSKIDLEKNSGEIICTRDGTLAGYEGEVSFIYEIKYKKGNITRLHSYEQVTSSDQNALDVYEEAYKNIFKTYENLDYYYNHITRDSNYVLSDTVIEYDKVDMEKLQLLENSEQSVIKNGKVSLNDWLEFAEKFGTTCTEK